MSYCSTRLMTFTLVTENTRKCCQAPFPIFQTGPGNEATLVLCVEPDTCKSILIFTAWCLELFKMKQNAKTVLVWLAFLINAHQNANQKPIGSVRAYWTQCALPPQPIYHTLLFNFWSETRPFIAETAW